MPRDAWRDCEAIVVSAHAAPQLGETLGTFGETLTGSERGLDQLGERVDLQLLHDLGAVRLDGLDADVEAFGDLAVHAARDHERHHLALALREERDALAIDA